MKWVAKLTREFTTLYHRLPSIRRANEDNRHQFAFPSYTSFNFFFVFDDHVLLYAPNNKSIKATAHRSATFNLGSGTRDTLHDAVHTRSISFSFVLLAVNYHISLLSRLFAGNFVAAPSQPTSRRLQKSHTAPRVSLSLSLSAPLLSQRVVVRAPWGASASTAFAAFTFTTFVSFVFSSSHRYHAIPTTSDLVFPAWPVPSHFHARLPRFS